MSNEIFSNNPATVNILQITVNILQITVNILQITVNILQITVNAFMQVIIDNSIF